MKLLAKYLEYLEEHKILKLIATISAPLLTVGYFLHDNLLLLVENNQATSTLAWITLGLLVLLLTLSISLLHLWYKNKLKFILGAFWDKKLNPYCPNCKKPLTYYGEYEFNKIFSPGYWCMKCKAVVRLYDGEKKYLGIDEAKKIIKERKLFN